MRLCFFDSESASDVDLEKSGGWKYTRDASTEILLLTYGFDNEPIKLWERGQPFPDDLRRYVEAGGYMVASNARFDRLLWQNSAPDDWPELKLRQVLCAQAQAEAFNLPGKLDKAAEHLKLGRKQKDGPRLIRKFCVQRKPCEGEDWERFKSYARKDTALTRALWQHTRPLSAEEWLDYWMLEEKNDRGVPFNVPFAEAAVAWVKEETEALNKRLKEVTGDPDITLGSHPRKRDWLARELEGSGLEECMISFKEGKEHIGCDANVRKKLGERLEIDDNRGLVNAEAIDEFLAVLDEGNGVATKKFGAVLRLHTNGRVHGQFIAHGAGQTGRESARGIQLQNVIRAGLPCNLGQTEPAQDAIACVMGTGPYGLMTRRHRVDRLEEWYGLPFQKILSRLIRPCIEAPPGKVLVWGDWSAIEGRVLPWLAGAEHKLDIYRSGRDVYCDTAQHIYGRPIDKKRDPDERQIGKVAELFLGYQGGIRAFQSAARNYGIKGVSDERADEIKNIWRTANPWAGVFWKSLDRAAKDAMRNPGIWSTCGRIRYIRRGQTLYCQLPSKRLITYPEARLEDVFVERFNDVVEQITYRKMWKGNCVRNNLYGGLQAENITQATANDVLRLALRERNDTIASVHDELILEVDEDREEAVKAELEALMLTVPPWADGLPLACEVKSGRYYEK